MVTYYSQPIRRYIVTHSAVDYDVEDATQSCEVHLRENAVDTASLQIADEFADYYSSKITSGDRLRVYFDYKDRPGASDPPTKLVFDGYIDDATPTLTKQGNILATVSRGVGRSILFTSCGEEYGSESTHDDLDTLQEIVTDATHGIVPKWVNKLFATATDTGFSLGTASGGTDYVADIAGAIPYVYFAYEPVKKALDDLCDTLQAIKGGNAGPHYIITPTNYLCMATVGNHEAGPTTLWSTWWNTDQANSTLEQGKDFVRHNFSKRAVEANYVLYHGHFRKPVNEQWTEEGDASNNGADLWTKDDASWTLSDDNVDYKVGATSVKMHINDQPVIHYAQVPNAAQNWEVDKWGGQYNKPRLIFQSKFEGTITNLNIRLYSGANYWDCNIFAPLSSGVWRQFNMPVGPYWDEEVDETFPGWTTGGGGAPDWGDVDYIRFLSACQALNTGDVRVDGLYFDAWLLRGARPAAAYSASNPVHMKVVTDDVAKDDSGVEATVTGSMARLSYAELLRAKSSPIQGTVVIPGQPDIMAGQLTHIHAAKTSSGTFRIDSDFRIQEHRLSFTSQGLISTLTLTSDVVNARPLPPKDAFNLLLKATNPDYQTRQISSIKARDIDITQPIMEHSY